MKKFLFLASSFLTLVGALCEGRAICFYFTQEHVDLSVQWNAPSNTLYLMASDDTNGGLLYASNECAVLCPEAMKFLLPPGTPLGNEGDPLWILPQNPYPDTPYVGVSAESIPPGVFEGPLTLRLHRVEGPGHFLLWQADAFGHFRIKMDSRDGIDANDRLTIPIGGHEHYNWGFTTSGTYRVYFQAQGRRLGQTNDVISPETPFTFHILPLRPFERWVTNHWPCECAAHVIAPGADPDADGIVNVFEYGLGNDPNVSLRTNLPECVVVVTNGVTYGALRYVRATNATDLEWLAVVAGSVPNGSWASLTNVVEIMPGEIREQVTLRDFLPTAAAPNRFYELRVRLLLP
jgi:surface-anchored protein